MSPKKRHKAPKGANNGQHCQRPNGFKRISWIAPDGSRPSIRLGQMDRGQAKEFGQHITAIVSAQRNRVDVSPFTRQWLENLPDDTFEKLVRVGLVEPRGGQRGVTLGDFISRYIKTREADAKPATIINMQATEKNLIGFFGKDRPLDAITAGDADEWRSAMVTAGLGDNTLRRRSGIARQFYAAAIRHELVTKNPFDRLKAEVRPVEEKFYFIKAEDAQKILDNCTTVEWKLIFALSRWGGLRCPSETLTLKWADVDFEHNRIHVTSPKTEHVGKGRRMIPLFPELRPLLLQAFEEAEPGTEYVIPNRRAGSNLRTNLEKAIKRAGLEPWPKLFINLRSTRETELAAKFPLHVVTKWLGNTELVAAKHYLQVTDSDFDRAAGSDQNKAAHKAAYSDAELGRSSENPEEFLNSQEVQNVNVYGQNGDDSQELAIAGFSTDARDRT